MLALIALLGVFGSLLLHELAHSLVAKRHGIKVEAITFFMFGGAAEITAEPKSAGIEFRIAIAGPLMSFFLSAAFGFLSTVVGGGIGQVMGYLSLINLVLAIFNLAPAFPMDGGRILRAWLWHRSGNLGAATRTATRFGGVFAIALMALGAISIAGGGLSSGLWQVMIGAFIYLAARGSYQQFLAKELLTDKTVANLMTTRPITVDPETTLEDLVNDVMLAHRISFVPVVEDGVLLGQIDLALVGRIDRENWGSTQVGDVFTGLDDAACVVPSRPVLELLTTMGCGGVRKFMVCRGHALVGVITLSDLIEYLNVNQRLNPD